MTKIVDSIEMRNITIAHILEHPTVGQLCRAINVLCAANLQLAKELEKWQKKPPKTKAK